MDVNTSAPVDGVAECLGGLLTCRRLYIYLFILVYLSVIIIVIYLLFVLEKKLRNLVLLRY